VRGLGATGEELGGKDGPMITLARAQSRDWPKPICRYCYVPCDPRSYEFRTLQTCQYCYDDVPLIIIDTKTNKEVRRCPPT
jgi:hypothetical protein